MNKLESTEDFFALKQLYSELVERYGLSYHLISRSQKDGFEVLHINPSSGIKRFIIRNNERGYHCFQREEIDAALEGLCNMERDINYLLEDREAA